MNLIAIIKNTYKSFHQITRHSILSMIGYIIGYLVALVISIFLPFKVSPDLFTISLTLVITIAIGLVFSITPANMAARKDLVEILR